MDAETAEQLERLVKLKGAGALTDAEFDAAKARLLEHSGANNARVFPGANDRQLPPTSLDWPTLLEGWRRRFEFMAAHGLPHTRTFTEASRTLPLLERGRIAFSPLAFLFGPIYFLYLGLWKPGLSLLGASIGYGYVLGIIGVPDALDRVSWAVPAGAYAATCIPLYFLKVRDGVHSWNPVFWWKS